MNDDSWKMHILILIVMTHDTYFFGSSQFWIELHAFLDFHIISMCELETLQRVVQVSKSVVISPGAAEGCNVSPL